MSWRLSEEDTREAVLESSSYGTHLLQLKAAMGSTSPYFKNWTSIDAHGKENLPCVNIWWHGITCTELGGPKSIVAEIQLGTGLSGPIPAGLLDYPMATVFLNGNNLSGPIPAIIGCDDWLKSLFLGDNSLTGPIPPSLTKCNALWDLDLSDNKLEGPIPAFANMPTLTTLELQHNRLTGGVPKSFAQLQNLQELDLSFNHLKAPVADLAFVADNLALHKLNVRNNFFYGPLPKEWSTLQIDSLSGGAQGVNKNCFKTFTKSSPKLKLRPARDCRYFYAHLSA
eukprot:jgi/Mesen1/4430/ME000225S03415